MSSWMHLSLDTPFFVSWAFFCCFVVVVYAAPLSYQDADRHEHNLLISLEALYHVLMKRVRN